MPDLDLTCGRHSQQSGQRTHEQATADALVAPRRPPGASGQGRSAGRTPRPPRIPVRGVAPQVFDTPAVQLRHNHDVARVDTREQAAECGSLAAVLWAGPLLHDLLASRLGQRTALRGGIVAVTRSDPEIADQHDSAAHDAARFTPEPPQCSAERKGIPRPWNSASAAAPRFVTTMDSTRASLHIFKLRNLCDLWLRLLFTL